MTPIRGPLARLDRSRDELAKAWLVRLIERASLEEISELPTEQIARELPDLISDIVGTVASTNGDPYELTDVQAERAAALAGLRSGRGEGSAAEVARHVGRRRLAAAGAHRRQRGRALLLLLRDVVGVAVVIRGGTNQLADQVR